MAWRLVYRCSSNLLPIEVDGILPDTTAHLQREQVERQPIQVGNQCVALAEFFDVFPSADESLVFEGDLRGVHWIGARLSSGQLRIDGNAGRHVGSEMQGGTLEVSGDVSDWAGAEMRGGHLQISGSAGHRLGAAYHGSHHGMTGGTICVQGNAGDEAGHSMRRGLIAVAGDIGSLAGFNMFAGTLIGLGNIGIRPGAGMRRGTLACLGHRPPELLSSFAAGCQIQPLAMRLLMRQLRAFGIQTREFEEEVLHLYHGDLLRGGRGELLTRVFA